MRNNIKYLLVWFLCIFTIQATFGQDAIVIGFNFDSPDGASVLALKDIPETQNIFVTETNYDAATNTFDRTDAINNGTVRITWTGTWAKGTIIEFTETSSNVLTTTPGPGAPADAEVVILYGDSFSYSSEGFSTFTSPDAADPDNNPTEIYSYVRAETASGGADPNPNDDPDCPCSPGFITVDLLGTFATDYGDYKVPPRADPVSEVDLADPGNWNDGPINVALDLTQFDAIALPIELSYFQTKIQGREVRIDWRTLIEINNDFFTIERSLDGKTFETLATVSGAGNSLVELDYMYIDMAPARGLNYYRLKQTDYDGTFSYSEVKSVNFDKDSKDAIAYPNPFNESISLQFPSSEENFSGNLRTIEVFDIYGKLAMRINLPMDENRITIDFSKLHSGTYFLHTLDGNQLVTNIQRIVKI